MTTPPTAKTIVSNWLEANGFDGLCADECGCELSDLVPCGDDFTRCTPGYKVPCLPDECAAGGCKSWHISPKKVAP